MRRMHGVVRPLLAAATTIVLAATLVGTAAAAKPTREVIDLDDPADEAFWSQLLTDACGFEVQADFEGRVTVHVFTDRNGEFRQEIDMWWILATFTNVATGTSVTLKDVGPDHYRLSRDGHLILSITGRSLTGSGVIGRVVIDLDTGEVLQMSGREVGSIEDQVCVAID